jgi:hypothetical protein
MAFMWPGNVWPGDDSDRSDILPKFVPCNCMSHTAPGVLRQLSGEELISFPVSIGGWERLTRQRKLRVHTTQQRAPFAALPRGATSLWMRMLLLLPPSWAQVCMPQPWLNNSLAHLDSTCQKRCRAYNVAAVTNLHGGPGCTTPWHEMETLCFYAPALEDLFVSFV